MVCEQLRRRFPPEGAWHVPLVGFRFQSLVILVVIPSVSQMEVMPSQNCRGQYFYVKVERSSFFANMTSDSRVSSGELLKTLWERRQQFMEASSNS